MSSNYGQKDELGDNSMIGQKYEQARHSMPFGRSLFDELDGENYDGQNLNTTRADATKFSILDNFTIDLIYELVENETTFISTQQDYLKYISSLNKKQKKFRNYITALIGFKNVIDPSPFEKIKSSDNISQH